MSKVLYPKSTAVALQKPTEAAWHIVYSDPSNSDDIPVMRHYKSELVAKIAAWYNCRFIGFNTKAVLYTNEEMKKING